MYVEQDHEPKLIEMNTRITYETNCSMDMEEKVTVDDTMNTKNLNRGEGMDPDYEGRRSPHEHMHGFDDNDVGEELDYYRI